MPKLSKFRREARETPAFGLCEGSGRHSQLGEHYAHMLNVYACAPRLIDDVHALAAWGRFDFNTGAFCSSKYATMIKAHQLIEAGQIKASCAQMDPWVYVAGIKVKGQIKRRARERAMCEAA